MKKILKFLGIVAIVALLAFALSVFLSRRESEPPALDRFEPGAEYQAADGHPAKITSEEASFAYALPGSTKLRYYHARSGEIKELDLLKPGRPTLVATIKPLATYISWSHDGSELIAQVGTEYRSYNLSKNTSQVLEKNISRPVFSKTTDDVAYLYFNTATGEGTISITNSRFKEFKTILKTRLDNWEIQWNDSRRLSLIATSTTTKLDSLFLLNTQEKDLTQLIDGQGNLEARWSPDGRMLLYSYQARTGTKLFLLSLETGTTTDVSISGNASECTWTSDSTTAYCAVEQGKEDSIMKIALDGKAELVLSPDEAGFVDARELLYVHSVPGLVFKNFKDGRLYLLKLQK